jgi:hypothetical protein
MPRFIAFHPARFLIVLVIPVLAYCWKAVSSPWKWFPQNGYSVDIAGVNRASHSRSMHLP